MSRLLRMILVVTLVSVHAPRITAVPEAQVCDPDGLQESGAIYRICMPDEGAWNGDLVVFAHGYVAPNEPVAIPEDQLVLPDGTSIPELVTGLGYAFAISSYSTNGLAVLEGINDLVDLVDRFTQEKGAPNTVYLVGASEGGIVTALAVERFPDVFDGGVASCGPFGDFRRQINYWGDFRAVFDYFFPDLIPGNPTDIPPEVLDNWETVYVPNITQAILSRPHATQQLLRVTRAPIDSQDSSSVESTVIGLLYYNVFATNDGIEKLGGQPFDNSRRLYFGSDNDLKLNIEVQRVEADQAALDEIDAHYQTSGMLVSPLVTLQNTKDPIIPYFHAPFYRFKAFLSGSSNQHVNIPVFRYGHCNFTAVEVLVAFAVLVFKIKQQELTGIESVLPDDDSRAEFSRMIQEHLQPPEIDLRTSVFLPVIHR